MLRNLLTSVLAFVSTNIDDIFILMLFYSTAKFRNSTIVIGQYLGIATLVEVSFAGAYIGSLFDQRYIGILGLFPIYLGLRQVVELVRTGDDDEDSSQDDKIGSSGIFAIAGVTIANGADNIGVYTPLLTTMSASEKIQMIIVFAAGTFLWCKLAQYLANHPLIAKQLEKYGHYIMPVVLLLLGIFILVESDTLSLLTT